MNPSAIRELTASAKNLHHTKRKGSPDAFILAWIAWEGFKLRMLAVAQKKQGAPVPSFNKFENLAQIHPYPWFKNPHTGSVRSFSSWRNKIDSKSRLNKT